MARKAFSGKVGINPGHLWAPCPYKCQLRDKQVIGDSSELSAKGHLSLRWTQTKSSTHNSRGHGGTCFPFKPRAPRVVLFTTLTTAINSPSSKHMSLFSNQVVSDSLRPHGLRQARPPVPPYLLGFAQVHVHWLTDAIQPSHPLSPSSPSPTQDVCSLT